MLQVLGKATDQQILLAKLDRSTKKRNLRGILTKRSIPNSAEHLVLASGLPQRGGH